jgi:D-lactate dehydrogenase (cytochrome)
VNRIVTRQPKQLALPSVETDPDVLRRYVEDAAHFPGGRAAAVTRPADVHEVAAVVRHARRVLAIGAQSSLTGGATPSDDIVLSTERLQRLSISSSTATVGAGVTLAALQQELARRNLWLPPVPTFLGATAGGATSTNAAGAATFKYGTTRHWVEGLTAVLANGELIEFGRGECVASEEGLFEIETARGVIQLTMPQLRMPDVPKCSAGYYSQSGMDLIDLFIGSEGTLAAIVDVTFRVAARPPAACWALVPMRSEALAIDLVEVLRQAARDTWASNDPRGLDVAAIEHIDRRALDLIKEDGIDRRLNVVLPDETMLVLIVQIELSHSAPPSELWAELADARSSQAPDTPLVHLCRILDRFGALDDTEIVLPDNAARRSALAEFRESAPASTNRRVALAQAQVDGRIHKTASDSIVPFHRFAEMMSTCRRLFAERGVDLAVWGHISDGNVHPNVIPRTYRDVEEGNNIMLELGRKVIEMGGSPLAEHGVGRSTMKQQLLRMLYGDAGITSMQRVKRTLDPEWKFARGVLFPFSESA